VQVSSGDTCGGGENKLCCECNAARDNRPCREIEVALIGVLPVSQFLKGGSPISDLPYAQPLNDKGKPGQWSLEIKEDDVKKIDASLQQTVKIQGQDHVRLHPDAIEDLWIVCEYQVLK